ncbi:uncharacterized membrane protein (DUF4010 family) [Bradyrhizobium sp. USDA 3311]
MLSASLREAFGEIGLVVSASAAGLADTHSPAVAATTLVASGKINSDDAIAPVLAALSTNTLSKIIVGWVSGGPSLRSAADSRPYSRHRGRVGRRILGPVIVEGQF